jgi:hypothetical protein
MTAGWRPQQGAKFDEISLGNEVCHFDEAVNALVESDDEEDFDVFLRKSNTRDMNSV